MQKRITMGRDKSVFAEFGKNEQIEMFCGEVLEECKGLLRFNFESQSRLCRACTKATQKFSVSPQETKKISF
jgi:hypothetical protein